MEKIKWFNQLYKIYCDEMEKIKEEPLDEVDFNDRLQNLVREEAHNLQ